jgi:hypothetical protein
MTSEFCTSELGIATGNYTDVLTFAAREGIIWDTDVGAWNAFGGLLNKFGQF